MKIRTCLMFMVLLANSLSVNAQRSIRIETNMPSANVFADTLWIGYASQKLFEVSSDVAFILVSPQTADSWFIHPITFDLLETPQSRDVTLSAVFPYHYRLESIPLGATVWNGQAGKGEVLGLTPFTLSLDEPLIDDFIFTLTGYAQKRVTPGNEIWNRMLIQLRPDDSGADVSLPGGFELKNRNGKWINYAASATAVLAGVAAIHFRTKADNRFDDFNENGSRGLKDDVKRLDIQSGVALGVMQVGIGIVAFRLIF